MNKTLIIIGIILGIASTLLVRPRFWKIIRKKAPIPENCSSISAIINILFFQIWIGAAYWAFLVHGLTSFDLRFNILTTIAIIALVVNIVFGNYALSNDTSCLPAFRKKNVLISCCVLVVFFVLTIIFNVQFSRVAVPTTKWEDESLESILQDESIAIPRKDLLELVNTNTSSFEPYASNSKIIYWDANSERKIATAIILQGNKCFVKKYDYRAPSLYESKKEIGFVVDDENHLYQAYAIIKYKAFKFYVDHYTLYDYDKDECIDYDTLPVWAINQ